MNTTKIKATATEYGFGASIDFETIEQRTAFVAMFPKSIKVHATECGGLIDGTYKAWPVATIVVHLTADANNGGTNETGLKRIQKFVAIAIANGYEIEHNKCYKNSLTDAEFNQLIGAAA